MDALPCDSAWAERLVHGLQVAPQVLVPSQAVHCHQFAGSWEIFLWARVRPAVVHAVRRRRRRRSPGADVALPAWPGMRLWTAATAAAVRPAAPTALACTSHAPALQGTAGGRDPLLVQQSMCLLLGRPRMRSGAVRPARAVRTARAACHQAALPLRQRVVRRALAVGLLAARPCGAHAHESAGCEECQS